MAKAGSRSLKAALMEAGLSDRTPDETLPLRRRSPTERHEAKPQSSREEEPRTETAAAREPRAERPRTEDAPRPAVSEATSSSLALFKDLIEKSGPSVPAHGGVVSPPPWLRAAKRGRRRTQLMNTFGWVMTLVVAGTIIGVAGRYLAVPPLGLESMQARPH